MADLSVASERPTTTAPKLSPELGEHVDNNIIMHILRAGHHPEGKTRRQARTDLAVSPARQGTRRLSIAGAVSVMALFQFDFGSWTM
jgi:hypothetical protein